jgi:hypothetical protein
LGQVAFLTYHLLGDIEVIFAPPSINPKHLTFVQKTYQMEDHATLLGKRLTQVLNDASDMFDR